MDVVDFKFEVAEIPIAISSELFKILLQLQSQVCPV